MVRGRSEEANEAVVQFAVVAGRGRRAVQCAEVDRHGSGIPNGAVFSEDAAAHKAFQVLA